MNVQTFTPLLLRLLVANVVAVIVWIAASPLAQAHPHAWIDLRSTVKQDEQGRVSALVMDWTFGLYYSAFILEDILKQGTPSPENLAKLLNETASENLKNLREYDYFTVVKADDEKQTLGDVAEFKTEIRDQRLWMRFEIPLPTPIDPKAHKITYAVFDPTYYIEILYAEKGPLVTFENTNTCQAEIIAPTPPTEVIGLAASLDQTQNGGDTLGTYFAETVALTCP
ncbi:DUF1007 family protein [Magnetovibrio blakemorei]|uniref:ABC transporter substrate-binding protein n=1 Tax=Magnetovibrio blakemorei TaxID=28181 RepID=A0A1E5Q753_9PROT|nr:DUF1007 family protein [Magnetovibrio blakemorei]OEJ66919.1 hypothetical protein BEN30_11025 [Magnetovibrio blakemorei]